MTRTRALELELNRTDDDGLLGFGPPADSRPLPTPIPFRELDDGARFRFAGAPRSTVVYVRCGLDYTVASDPLRSTRRYRVSPQMPVLRVADQ